MVCPNAKPGRILVVDDEPLILQVLETILQGGGYSVELAGGAEQALAILARSNFDVIITDFQMPGLKGDEFAMEVKARTPRQRIMMLTGMPEQVPALGQPPVIDIILRKPFRSQDLLQTVQNLLNDARQDSPPSIEGHPDFSPAQLYF